MFVRSTDVEALEEHQSTLRGVASLAQFREKCTTALREARAERDSNTARLHFPVRAETAECVLTERIESAYRDLFDRINKELRAEKKRAEDKTKNELILLEKLNASAPEKLLDGYITSVVDREFQHAGVTAVENAVGRTPQVNTTAVKVVEAIASTKSKTACPLAEARGKERALRPNKTRARAKEQRRAKARAKTRTRRAVPRTKKRPQAKARARNPTRPESCCEQGLTQGTPCSAALRAKGLLQTCKDQRTEEFTSCQVVCVTLEERT